ncbi:ribonuclease Y [Thermospira aquatica]|uniref:Ribonuclease Y n=1 Tax=Thermospira aquatica TaxID=2828656 RepID=A0AAX3BG49_9SPIR|nr:ribonuclease Y [Thermospira aquatica]URA11261.1 ribonuclease Y [Thermospira aquatica]
MLTKILGVLIPSLIGIGVGFFLRWLWAQFQLKSAEKRVSQILEAALREAETKKREMLLEAKDKLLEERRQLEKEFRERSVELQQNQRRLMQKEDLLDKRMETLDKKEQELEQERRLLKQKAEELQQAHEKHLKELERIAQMTAEQAKQMLINEMLEEAKKDSITMIKKMEDEAKDQAESRAREIILSAIQRNAAEVTAEKAISTITLPNDEMKGRIIGREGRNIRSFEAIAGVDLIIDDTPEVVVISSFDPYRREVAKRALEVLMQDGRIHPARIEEVIQKITKEMEQNIVDAGKQACIDLKIILPRELYPYIGRLKYRTSYGQNVYDHVIEVANIAGMIAGELRVNVEYAKMAGLLHDIGKGIKTLGEGVHATVGADVASKYGLPDEVVNAIAAHHGEVEAKYLTSAIVSAADAISASRPGARRESFENYIKRLQTLEGIATSFEGVEKAYAIQAGREVRIFVASDKVDDQKASIMARDIAKKIENEMKYPGQIKITLIRETRIIEYAR